MVDVVNQCAYMREDGERCEKRALRNCLWCFCHLAQRGELPTLATMKDRITVSALAEMFGVTSQAVYAHAAKRPEWEITYGFNNRHHTNKKPRVAATVPVDDELFAGIIGAAGQNGSDVAQLNALPYGRYLRTQHWKRKRAEAIGRAKCRCQLCNQGPMDGVPLEVHHRTYERRGTEAPEDLTVLCLRHHKAFHGYEEGKLIFRTWATTEDTRISEMAEQTNEIHELLCRSGA